MDENSILIDAKKGIKTMIYDIIYQEKNFRIIEVLSEVFNIKTLKSDCFNPDVNKDINPEQLRKEEIEFDKKVNREGVYGYVLEKWDSQVDRGWIEIDACYGFVGKHEDNNHYIVEELKKRI